MTVPSDVCPECGRTVLEKGRVYDIEAALDRDGDALAHRYLLALGEQKKTQHLLADVLIRLEAFASSGRLSVPRELNQLTDELFEIKVGTIRLPFYYREDAVCGQIRITHGFQKRSEKTPRSQIERGTAIIREDRKR